MHFYDQNAQGAEIMERGNDAIPSWSGFNFQGKMAILCALQVINKNSNVGDYSIELEKHEDFTILKKDKTIALYQVKAILSQKKHSYYTSSTSGESVAEKLVRHKKECGNYLAQCFLASSIDIDNWDDKDNPYRKEICLYKYHGNTVSIKDCPQYIQEEIKIFLKSTNPSTGTFDVQSVYGKLCVFLDKKIASMHSQSFQDRIYSIPLSDFVDVMRDTVITITEQNEFHQNEKVYQYLQGIFHELIPNYCENDCLESSCNPDCVIHRLEEEFSRINDIRKYIEVINPSITTWENHLDYVSHASVDALRKHIVYAFYCSQNADAVRIQHNGITFKSDLSYAKNKLVLPTLLSIGANINRSLESALQNIKSNTFIQPSIAGNTLLAAMDMDITLDLQKDCISSRWAVCDEQSINNPYAGTEIVSEKFFLEELKNEYD